MVTIYSKDNCVQCRMAKYFLDNHHVEYYEINLDHQPEFISHIKEMGFSSVPVIQTNDQVFSGFQLDKLKRLL